MTFFLTHGHTDFIKNCCLTWMQSVQSSTIAAALAAKFLAPYADWRGMMGLMHG